MQYLMSSFSKWRSIHDLVFHWKFMDCIFIITKMPSNPAYLLK